MTSFQNIAEEVSKLVPFEIFDYYDGPRFYSCKDRVGQLFVVYWIDSFDGKERWLYQRISNARYQALKAGNFSVAWAFSNPEDEYSYVVSAAGTDFSFAKLAPIKIDPTWLPPADYFLAVASSELPPKVNSAQQQAFARNRNVFDIAFERITNSHEIGCGKLGRALEALQNSVYAFTVSATGNAKRISEEIRNSGELLVTGTFESSFGIRLESKQGDLIGDGKPEQAVRTLVELLNETNSPDVVVQALKTHSVLARSRFKHFLAVSVDAGLAVKTEWASPNGDKTESRSTFGDLVATLNRLNETEDATTETATYSGKLVGVDIESDFFAIKVADTGLIIKGKLTKSLESQLFEVPSQVIATIEESCIIDPLTEKEKWTNTLVRLATVDGAAPKSSKPSDVGYKE